MSDLSSRLIRPRFARFLISGAFNTALTYIAYLLLLNFASYQVSYTIAFLAGILLSYYLNKIFVFKARGGLLVFFLTPIIYLTQYAIGLGIALVWVETLQLSVVLAPLAAICVTIPMTYALTKFVFTRTEDSL